MNDLIGVDIGGTHIKMAAFVRIVPADLGEWAGAYGAAWNALQR